jgi:hypothetical protein
MRWSLLRWIDFGADGLLYEGGTTEGNRGFWGVGLYCEME